MLQFKRVDSTARLIRFVAQIASINWDNRETKNQRKSEKKWKKGSLTFWSTCHFEEMTCLEASTKNSPSVSLQMMKEFDSKACDKLNINSIWGQCFLVSTHKFAQKALYSSRDIPLSVTHTLKVGSFFPIAIHRTNI